VQYRADHVERLQKRPENPRVLAVVRKAKMQAEPLTGADVGVAIGAGPYVAVEAGHIVPVGSEPRHIHRVFTLSGVTYRKIVHNLRWAAGDDSFAVLLAAGVIASWGIPLTPAVDAVLSPASMVVVAIDAQLLNRVGQ
jgi:Cu2+-exporting ATPase